MKNGLRPLRLSDTSLLYRHDGDDGLFYLLDAREALENGIIVTPKRKVMRVIGIKKCVQPMALELDLICDHAEHDDLITVKELANTHNAYVATLVGSDDDPVIRKSRNHACCQLAGEQSPFYLRDELSIIDAEFFVTPSRKLMRVTGCDMAYRPPMFMFELEIDYAEMGADLSAEQIASKHKCPLAVEVGGKEDKIIMVDYPPPGLDLVEE